MARETVHEIGLSSDEPLFLLPAAPDDEQPSAEEKAIARSAYYTAVGTLELRDGDRQGGRSQKILREHQTGDPGPRPRQCTVQHEAGARLRTGLPLGELQLVAALRGERRIDQLWAEREKKRAKGNPRRRTMILEILVSAQRGECASARAKAQEYQRLF